MKKYYINNNRQDNGDYEVHAERCAFFPVQDYTYLGEFFNCGDAVSEAKMRFPLRYRINGCYFCSINCHTS